MKYREAREKRMAAIELINYCHKNGFNSIHLNYALNKNLDILNRSEKAIQAGAPAELVELEKKIMELGKEHAKEDEKNLFAIGLTQLTEEEKAKHDELSKQFNDWLEEESEYKIFTVNMDKVPDFAFDYGHTDLLMNFIE